MLVTNKGKGISLFLIGSIFPFLLAFPGRKSHNKNTETRFGNGAAGTMGRFWALGWGQGSPFRLVPNVGQWESPAIYVGRMGAMTFFAETCGWTFTLEGGSKRGFRKVPLLPWDGEEDRTRTEKVTCVAIRMTFAGVERKPRIVPEKEKPGYFNYFLGNDPSRWRTKVKGYGAIRYQGLYPGIDLVVGAGGRGLEYDLFLQPGADLGKVKVCVEGVERLEISPQGALVMKTQVGDIIQPRPRTWEVRKGGGKKPVICSYRLLGERSFGFQVESWDGKLPLVLDPEIVWSTFIGGSIGESAWDMIGDGKGNLIMTGTTNSNDYPTTPGAFSRTYKGGIKNFGDAFVTKMNGNGKKLIWSTFLGGKESDVGYCVALDGKGNVVVTGPTPSPDFPTTQGAYDRTYNGPSPSNYRIGYGGDAFVACLSGDGTKLVWSTYLGGKGMDYPMALVVGPKGNVVIGGGTESFDFPTTPGAFMPKHKAISIHGNYDGFLGILDVNGRKLIASTYLGGDGNDGITGIANGKYGEVSIAGITVSKDFPVTKGAFDRTYNDKPPWTSGDTFISRLDQSFSRLIWSTYLGGEYSERVYGIQLFKNGDALVFGNTESSDFPTTKGVFQPKFKGDWSAPGHEPDDCFLARLDSSGSRLVWSTFIGGKSFETIKELELDESEVAWFVGVSASTGFPVTPGSRNLKVKNRITPPADIIYGRMSPDGRRLLWASFIGGNSYDNGISLSIGPGPVINVAGATNSPDYPVTQGAFDTKYDYPSNIWDVSGDIVLSRLVAAHEGIRRYGKDTPSCKGAVTIYANGPAKSGNKKFGLSCWKAPCNAAGILVLGTKGLSAPIRLFGVDLWVDPGHGSFVAIGATSDNDGKYKKRIPIPPGVQGLRAYAQFLWVNTKACPGNGALCSSDALEINIQ